MTQRRSRSKKGRVRRAMTGDDLWVWRVSQRRADGAEWSQADAATWYGVHGRTWRRWENGESNIPIHVQVRIAEEER